MQSFKGKKVVIREVTRNEISRFDDLMEELHYIGKAVVVVSQSFRLQKMSK